MAKSIEVQKGWGKEIHIHNSPEYCGKLLVFNKDGRSSLHYHLLKSETWFCQKGNFIFMTIDPVTCDKKYSDFRTGEVMTIPKGMIHQLQAIEDSVIFEVSTQDFPDDSYRVSKGDSQK